MEQLAAHDRRECQFLVDAGHEMDPMLFEKVIRPGEGDVVPAQRRSLVPGNQASGFDARAPVPPHLLDRQAHQGLDTGHICRARFQRVLIVKRYVTSWHSGVSGFPAGCSGGLRSRPTVLDYHFR